MERKIEIVCMELIKPLSPTPNHLRCFEFSYLDQMAIPIFSPLVLYYPPQPQVGESQARIINSSKVLHLKKSLSETLARFYPFAGRIKDNTIECNDDGVPFYEAFAHNYKLEDILRKPQVNKHFLPSTIGEGSSLFQPDAALHPLLVQVTTFECGGMAIGICASHKVTDGATWYTLANAWAVTTARGSSPDIEFVAAAKFLPPPIPHVTFGPNLVVESTKFYFNEERVIKMFVFDGSTIASLKAKAVSDDVRVPTRVEVVSAVIWKCAMAAASGNNGTRQLAHMVNIRKRFVPPLPNHCVGNASAVATSCKLDENDVSDLPTLVTCIRKGLSQLCSKYVDKQSRDEAILNIPYDMIEVTCAHLRGEIDIQITSLCGYQFYDVDFGWGKPSWVSVNQMSPRDYVLLMDSRDSGGIEAWVCLKDKDSISVFEQEFELLVFGSAKN